MKNIIKLNRDELLCAISDYLHKKGYTISKKYYYPCVTFQMGTIDIGTQREPESIETVVGVECTLEE